MEKRVFEKAIAKVLKARTLGRVDLHMHTIISDGELLPMELIRRCEAKGYSAVCLSDHVSFSNYQDAIRSALRDCIVACKEMDILAIPGVEITHVPPKRIPELARLCREAGALLVVVHGETVVEPVPPGTDRAAAGCMDVDILAHPGLITGSECKAARKNGVFLEITSRKGHNTTNGHVLITGRKAGCGFLVNTDAHSPQDLIEPGFARTVGAGAGMSGSELTSALERNPRELLSRILKRLAQ